MYTDTGGPLGWAWIRYRSGGVQHIVSHLTMCAAGSVTAGHALLVALALALGMDPGVGGLGVSLSHFHEPEANDRDGAPIREEEIGWLLAGTDDAHVWSNWSADSTTAAIAAIPANQPAQAIVAMVAHVLATETLARRQVRGEDEDEAISGDWDLVVRRLSVSNPNDQPAIWRLAARRLGATKEEAMRAVLVRSPTDEGSQQWTLRTGGGLSEWWLKVEGADLAHATAALCRAPAVRHVSEPL